MNAYERLCAFLKIVVENLLTLHHNLVGGNWFSDHERLGDYYDKLSDMADAVIERGLSLGYREPSIAEAVLAFTNDVLPSENRGATESFSRTREYFRSLAGMMDAAMEDAPPDVQNKLQEWQYWLNLEADYKLARLLQASDARIKSRIPEDDD